MTRFLRRLAIVLFAFFASSSFSSPAPESESESQVHNADGPCTTTINSAADITAANLICTTININSFNMTAGVTMALTGLANDTTVNLLGEVTFGVRNWAGPLFQIGTSDPAGKFTFNGGGHILNGQGASYWDGWGIARGVIKPHPMVQITHGGGTFKDVVVLNSPAHAVSVSSSAPLVMSGVTVDDSAGTSLGVNTDCFDVGASHVILTGNTCKNQDDCLAVNFGKNITFSRNNCSGGHGISIAVDSHSTVRNVTIIGNAVTNSANGLRIKTVYGATNASVTDVNFKNNMASGIKQYGVMVEQDYVLNTTQNGSPKGTPSNGVILGPVTFSGTNKVAVSSGAERVHVLCGSLCTGTWDWSGLSTSGGKTGSSNYNAITGYKM